MLALISFNNLLLYLFPQVDVSMSNAFSSGLPVTADLPAFSSGTKSPQAIDENVHTDVECNLTKPFSYGVTEPEKPINEQQPKNEELNFPIDESLLVGQGVSPSPVTGAMPPVSYPIIDWTKEYNGLFYMPLPMSLPAPVLPSAPAPVLPSALAPVLPSAPASAPIPAPVPALAPVPVPVPEAFPAPSPVVKVTLSSVNEAPLSPVVDTTTSSAGTSSKKVVEEALLKELEDMGFKQVDLNKEILRMNEYNLEQSVDDLCGVSEWDPLLEELEDMVSSLL